MSRFLKAVAWLCIAIVALATVASVGAEHFTAILAPVWLLFAPVLVVLLRAERTRASERSASLRALLPSRAPPIPLSPA